MLSTVAVPAVSLWCSQRDASRVRGSGPYNHVPGGRHDAEPRLCRLVKERRGVWMTLSWKTLNPHPQPVHADVPAVHAPRPSHRMR